MNSNGGYGGSDRRTLRGGGRDWLKHHLERLNDRMVTLPSDVSGVIGWWQPRILGQWLSDTAQAAVLPDLTGNARGLAGAYNATPAYRTGIVNGRPVLRFNGSSSCLRNTFAPVSPPYTLFVVARWNSGYTTQTGVLDSSDDLKGYLFRAVDSNSVYFFNGSQIGPVTYDSTQWGIYRVICTGTSGSSLRVNNGTAATGTLSNQALNGLTFGCRGGGTELANCDLGDVVLASGALGSTDCATIEGYLAYLYGVTLS